MHTIFEPVVQALLAERYPKTLMYPSEFKVQALLKVGVVGDGRP